jgi:two-component system sensor histidine kinase KdpD
MEKNLFEKIKGFDFISSAALTALVTLLCAGLKGSIDAANFPVLYLVTVVMSAVWWGMAVSVFSALLGALAFDFFLVAPYYSLSISDLKYIYILIGFITTGVIVSLVASRSRRQTIEAKQREARTLLLFRLSREMAECETLGQVIDSVRKNTGELLGCFTAVYLPGSEGITFAGGDETFQADDHEKAVAHWVFSNREPAGRGTLVLNAAQGLYVPLETSQEAVGVLGVLPRDGREIFRTPEMELLTALANQSSVAIQRAKLAESSREMELAKQTQALQAALLNSISHDLRTPLVSITGALSTLSRDFESVDVDDRGELLQTAYEDSLHLNEIVGNLLDMTRVESGNLKLNIRQCDLRDLIGASLKALKDKLENRKVTVDMAEGVFEIPVDYTLMMRVFINLVDNAEKYSPAGSEIIIKAETADGEAVIQVKDSGFGIPGNDLEHIFDKFFRAVKPRQVSGTGLGLSICRGIVEAHGGSIWAQNNPDKGAVFFIKLPMKPGTDEKRVRHGK